VIAPAVETPTVGSVTTSAKAVVTASTVVPAPSAFGITSNTTTTEPGSMLRMATCVASTLRVAAISALKSVSKFVRSAEPFTPATVSKSPARVKVAAIFGHAAVGGQVAASGLVLASHPESMPAEHDTAPAVPEPVAVPHAEAQSVASAAVHAQEAEPWPWVHRAEDPVQAAPPLAAGVVRVYSSCPHVVQVLVVAVLSMQSTASGAGAALHEVPATNRPPPLKPPLHVHSADSSSPVPVFTHVELKSP
jgi:hypothetical protein